MPTNESQDESAFTGRCTAEKLSDFSPVITHDPPLPTCMALTGDILLTTSPMSSPSPPLYLRRDEALVHTLYGSHRTTQNKSTTAICLDQSPPSSSAQPTRISVFYDTGDFSIFYIDHATPKVSRRLITYQPHRKSERTSPIRQAAYHHPLLITLSDSFRLSLYNLSGENIVHTQTLTSFTSFPPTSLVLSALSSRSYKLILAYAVPVYPQHWSVAATELTISSSLSSGIEDQAPCTVTSSRTTGAHDLPQGWIDEGKLQEVREQWSRKVAGVADTQTDGKWVVLAPADRITSPTSNQDIGDPPRRPFSSGTSCTLQLYRLHLPSTSNPNVFPRLTFVRMLHGHEGAVVALALADGRCVSLGADGSLWVWDLERGWSAEIQGPQRTIQSTDHAEEAEEDASLRHVASQGTILFDERQIVSADLNGIEVRRFDT